MFHLHKLFSRALVALALSVSAGGALAVPVSYHVNVDMTSLSGEGLLDLAFISRNAFQTGTALLSNFTGSYGGVFDAFGAIEGDVSSSVTLGNAPGDNYLTQVVNFGGMFGFDILFDFDASDIGTTFALNLYLPEFSGFAFGEGALVQVDLNPGAVIAVNAQAPFASIVADADVPEPGQWALMFTGLLLIAAMARRRSR